MLFEGSFSEYRPHLLTAMMVETFFELHYLLSIAIDFDYIDAYKPDIVVAEIVEWFMLIVPIDNFNLDVHVQESINKCNELHKIGGE